MYDIFMLSCNVVDKPLDLFYNPNAAQSSSLRGEKHQNKKQKKNYLGDPVLPQEKNGKGP